MVTASVVPDSVMQSMNEAQEKPLVDVWMITYNHEKYIAQAIESVMMQKTSFPYRLVIGEDCSTDSTRKICKEYSKKYPEKIHLILHEKNTGGQRNSYIVHKHCTAEYVAMLEGDDYWTDPLKLQKQVDYMKSNPDCAACFHQVIYKLSESESTIFPDTQIKPKLKLNEIIASPRNGWVIMTSTIMYAKKAVPDIPKWFTELEIGDYTVIMLAALNGNIGFIKEVLGAYRLNPGGLMQSKEYSEANLAHKMISLYFKFNKHTKQLYKYEIYEQILRYLYQLIFHYKTEKKIILYYIYTIKFNYYNINLKHNRSGKFIFSDYVFFLFRKVKNY